MKSRQIVLLLAGVLAVPAELLAAPATFQSLGSLPFFDVHSQAAGVSGNGLVAFGTSASYNGGPAGEPFVWTSQQGMLPLANYAGGPLTRFPTGANYDGSVIVGNGAFPYSSYVAVRWTNGVAAPMPGFGGNILGYSAHDVSGDGSVIVGWGTHDGIDEAVAWINGNIIGLGDLPGGYAQSYAYKVSGDGTTVAGVSYSDNYVETFRWTAQDGMVGIGTLSLEWGGESSPRGVSADGSVIVGVSDSPDGTQAFRWTEATGMVGLGDFPGGNFYSGSLAITADGSMILGFGTDSAGPTSFLWTESGGMISLIDYFSAHQVQGMEGWSQIGATGMSDDGRTFVGTALNPSHTGYEAWIVTVPEPSSGMLALVAVVGILAISLRRASKRHPLSTGR